MHSFTTIIAASAFFASISASPILPRAICGTAPAGSGSATPLSQPTGINTAAACQAQCNGNPACQSFVFGMVNNVNECMLFSVPAASVPKQSTNLIAFDKACTSVPAIVPTAANPSGRKLNKLTARAICGSAPSGPTGQTPLSQPTGITTAALCQAQCNGNSACLSFVFGMVNSVDQCMLFSVAASSVPPQSTNLMVFDKACTGVPTVVPTTANPSGVSTGANTGGNTGASTPGNTGTNGGNTGATKGGQAGSTTGGAGQSGAGQGGRI